MAEILYLHILVILFHYIAPVNPPTPPDDIQTLPPSLGTISVVLPQLDGIDTGEL